MLFYRAALPLSCQTLTFVSDLIRAHRRELGSVWRKLNPGQQAMLVLVYLRKGEPFAEVGAGFDVSTTTCWRYVNETVELLAQRAPKLRAALRRAKRQKMAYVIIDGTLIPIDRIAVEGGDSPVTRSCSPAHPLSRRLASAAEHPDPVDSRPTAATGRQPRVVYGARCAGSRFPMDGH